MAFTFVGTSIITAATSATPTTYTIPLPTGTQVGDYLVLWTRVDGAYSTTDARMTERGLGGGSGLGLFTGRATTLVDIDIDADFGYLAGLIYLVSVRGPNHAQRFGNEDQVSGTPYMANGDNTGSHPLGFAVSCTFDQAVQPDPAPALGTDGDGNWTALTEQAYAYSDPFDDYDLVARGYYLPGVRAGDVPLLNSAVSGTYYRRQSRGVYWDSTGEFSSLRQRQSPLRTPSRVRPPQLRQRQRPEVI